MRPLPPPGPCPECRDGKCVNCDGTTWDFRYDEYTLCPCYEVAHEVGRIQVTDD